MERQLVGLPDCIDLVDTLSDHSDNGVCDSTQSHDQTLQFIDFIPGDRLVWFVLHTGKKFGEWSVTLHSQETVSNVVF